MEENTLKPSLADWFKPFPFKLGQLLLGYRGSEVTLVVLSYNRVVYKKINTPS